MAKQIIVLALIIFFAAVGMTAANEPNVPAAAASIAPAAAAAGLNISNASELIGALSGAAADAAPMGGPIPEGVFKNLAPGSAPPTGGAAAVKTSTAAAGAIAAGVVGSLFF